MGDDEDGGSSPEAELLIPWHICLRQTPSIPDAACVVFDVYTVNPRI